MNNKIERMQELIKILNEASISYYQHSISLMTDYEYDKLYDELVELEKETIEVIMKEIGEKLKEIFKFDNKNKSKIFEF